MDRCARLRLEGALFTQCSYIIFFSSSLFLSISGEKQDEIRSWEDIIELFFLADYMTFAFRPTVCSKYGFDTGIVLGLVFYFLFLPFSLYATLSILLAFDARAGRKNKWTPRLQD